MKVLIPSNVLQDAPPFTRLMFAILMVVVCALIFLGLGYLFAYPIFGMGLMGLNEVMQDMNHPDFVPVMKYMQTIQSIGLFVIPPFIIALFLGRSISSYLHLNRRSGILSILLVIVIVYFANPMINFLAELNSGMGFPEWLSGVEDWMRSAEDQAGEMTHKFLSTDSWQGLLFNVFMIGLIPAVGEELLFRGIIQRLLKEITGNYHTAIWVSAALFSALHLQFYGFIPRMMLGALFGYFLEWSGSLWLPMIAHFVNNATAVILYYFAERGIIGTSMDEIGTSAEGNSFLALGSLFFVSLLMLLFYYQVKRETDVIPEE